MPSMDDVIVLHGMDPRIALVRDWAPRTAVVVGQALHPSLIGVLSGMGFPPVVMSPDGAASITRTLGPVSFFLLGPDVFDDDSSVAAVRAWHRTSPSAQLKLVYPGTDRRPEVLIRAIRAGINDVLDPNNELACEVSLRQGMLAAGATRERVLAIGAHPDDVEIGCAGTLLDHRMRGDRVTILTLSRGAIGGDTAQRVNESAAMADAMGAQLLFADLPDTQIGEGVETIRLIESVVQTLDPTVVYVHSPHDNHQDHRAVSIATRSATRSVRRVFAYQSPSATDNFLPTQFVNVDETVRRKVEVLQLLASQDGRSYLEPELVVAGARYWARHLAASARYAEPFEVIRSVGELRQHATAPVFDTEDPAAPGLTIASTHLHSLPAMVVGGAPDLALNAINTSAELGSQDGYTASAATLAGTS